MAYYDAQHIVIFPSSNRADDGKVNSETNFRELITRLRVNNYKIDNNDNLNVTLNSRKTAVDITSGSANINGYLVKTDSTLTVNLPSSNGEYYLLMTILQDANEHVKGDNNITQCEGVDVHFQLTSLALTNNDLILAKLSKGSTIELTNNESINPFSSDSIQIDKYNSESPSGSLTEYIHREDNDPLSAKEMFVFKHLVDTKKLKLNIAKSNDDITIILDPDNNSIESTNGTNSSFLKPTSVEFYKGTNRISRIVNGDSYLGVYFGNTRKISVSEVESSLLYNNNNYLSVSNNSLVGKVNGKDVLNISDTNTKINNIVFGDKSISANSGALTIGDIQLTGDINLGNYSVIGGSNRFNSNGLAIGTSTSINDNITTIGYILSGTSSRSTQINKDSVLINSNSSTGFGKISFKYGTSEITSISFSNSPSNRLTINSDLSVSGNITANKVYNAVYNGMGEIFRKSISENIEYGDIVCIRSDGLAHKFTYGDNINSIIGICSDTIGFELGGENIPKDEQVEVEFIGQIWVKTDDKNILPGNILSVTNDGKVKIISNNENKFAIALTKPINGKVKVFYH